MQTRACNRKKELGIAFPDCHCSGHSPSYERTWLVVPSIISDSGVQESRHSPLRDIHPAPILQTRNREAWYQCLLTPYVASMVRRDLEMFK